MNAQITVRARVDDEGWVCRVTVAERGSRSEHTVTVSRAYLEQLAGPQGSPERLVEKSFEFLLGREPKESILREFDLTVIRRYFPDYEQQIRRLL